MKPITFAHGFRNLDQHWRERCHRRGIESAAFGSGRGRSTGHTFIDIQARDQLVLEFGCKLLTPLGRAGERLFLAIPAAGHDRAPRALLGAAHSADQPSSAAVSITFIE